MKNLILLCTFMISSLLAVAQTPTSINYQAAIKNNNGDPIANQNVSVIVEFNIAGQMVAETVEGVTDSYGVLSIKLGTNDVLKDIDWAAGNATMKSQIMTEDGNIEFGTVEMSAVPYAFYAETSGSSIPGPAPAHEWNGTEVRFENPDGSFGDWINVQGPQGNSVKVVGSVENSDALDTEYSGNIGDLIIDQSGGDGYVWDGQTWLNVGSIQGPEGAQGLQGIQGEQGLSGSTGLQGSQGVQGLKGDNGEKGNVGEKGERGLQGNQGEKGDKGDKGDAGEQGQQGIQGEQGDAGKDGTGVNIIGSVNGEGELDLNYAGDAGDMFIDQNTGAGYVWDGGKWNAVGQIQGPSGLQGDQGIQGFQGEQGSQGLQGDIGLQGIQGIEGTKGDKGDQGKNGEQGQQGTQGLQGSQGIQGVQGNDGTQGTPGINGQDGVNGSNGTDGTDGVDGKDGNKGADGQNGKDGENGINGLNGDDGKDGAQGIQGDTGKDGNKGDTGNDGIGVIDAIIEGENLFFKLSDGSTVGVGSVKGPKGDDGANGKDGDTGKAGTNGMDGAKGDQGEKGMSVTDAVIEGENLFFKLSDGSTVGVGSVKGPKGENGKDGQNGSNGQDGEDGKDGANGTCTCPLEGSIKMTGNSGSFKGLSGTNYTINYNDNGYYINSNKINVNVTPIGQMVFPVVTISGGSTVIKFYDIKGDPKQTSFFLSIFN